MAISFSWILSGIPRYFFAILKYPSSFPLIPIPLYTTVRTKNHPFKFYPEFVSAPRCLMMLSVVYLLRAAWIAATLPIVIACLPLPKIAFFRELLIRASRRGKTLQSSYRSYFWHFYLLGVAWTTLLLAGTWLYAFQIAPEVSEPMLYSSIASQLTGASNEFSLSKYLESLKEHQNGIWDCVFLLLLMEAQVLRRLFESIYVFKYSPSARMHILGYLAGLFFYTAAPLSLCCAHASDVFNFVANLCAEFIVKGKDKMQVRDFDLWGHVYPLMHLKWYVWVGAAFYSWGWIHQRRCHAILGSLRENDNQVEDYVIPYGDWFTYVSSPHYLAEMVMYGSLVIASGFSDVTIWLPFGFVVANLSLAAAETHRWYLRKFENYPRNRCTLIPFIY